MTRIDLVQPDRDLGAEILAAHEAAYGATCQALQHARRAGDLLIEAKSQLTHGDWLPWLAQHCAAISERTVQNYMRIAREWPRIEAHIKSATVADLPLRQAVALLAEPREDVAADGTPAARMAAADEALRRAIRNKLLTQRHIARMTLGPPAEWHQLMTPEGREAAIQAELAAALQQLHGELGEISSEIAAAPDDVEGDWAAADVALDAAWDALRADGEALRARGGTDDPYELLDIIDCADELVGRAQALTARTNRAYRRLLPDLRQTLDSLGISAPPVLFQKWPLEMNTKERAVCDQFFETLVVASAARVAELEGET